MTENHDDRFWTAFQYAVGELTDDEAARFETLLADDQRAREALTEALARAAIPDPAKALDRKSVV